MARGLFLRCHFHFSKSVVGDTTTNSGEPKDFTRRGKGGELSRGPIPMVIGVEKRFSSRVFAGVRGSWHNLLSGSEHFVSAHFDVSVASGWKTSAPNLPSGTSSVWSAQGLATGRAPFSIIVSSFESLVWFSSLDHGFDCSG